MDSCLPLRVKALDLSLSEDLLSSTPAMIFIQHHWVTAVGVWPGSMRLCQGGFHWETRSPLKKHGSRVPDVFWFMLLQSHYIQESNHSDETGFSSLKTLTQWSWQGAIELRCHPQIKGKQHWVFLLWVAPHKHTLFIQGPLLAPHKGGQRRERLAYWANEKQLGQVPNLNQACELNKAHCIDSGVIHYLLWM